MTQYIWLISNEHGTVHEAYITQEVHGTVYEVYITQEVHDTVNCGLYHTRSTWHST